MDFGGAGIADDRRDIVRFGLGMTGWATGLAGLLVVAASSLLAAPASAQDTPRWSLAIHGGAGVIERADLSPEQDAAYRAALNRALDRGAEVLSGGGTALDAVQAAVEVMEDDPLFNAGRGAVFTSAGRNELDAAIMDGTHRNAGAVAGLTTTRHPIAAARAVMDQSPHVMLIGQGADIFAALAGLEQVEPAFFFTERRWNQLERALTRRGDPIPSRPEGAPVSSSVETAPGSMADLAPLNERKFGTVGAVAIDQNGRLAAATSTGGQTAKRWGRVGDVPVIGAGTYASNADGCAVSATGDGEYYIRASVARDICARIAAGSTTQAAAQAEVEDALSLGGYGGVIVMDAGGRTAMAMTTSGMYRGAVSSDTPARVAIYADE